MTLFKQRLILNLSQHPIRAWLLVIATALFVPGAGFLMGVCLPVEGAARLGNGFVAAIVVSAQVLPIYLMVNGVFLTQRTSTRRRAVWVLISSLIVLFTMLSTWIFWFPLYGLLQGLSAFTLVLSIGNPFVCVSAGHVACFALLAERRRSRKRLIAGFRLRCLTCGYSLKGLPTAICPECGNQYSSTPTPRTGDQPRL